MDPTTIVGTAAFLLSAVQIIQMGRSVMASDDPSGVAPATWLLMLGQAVAWIVFGWVERLWPSFGINALVLAISLGVMHTLRRGRAFALVAAGVAALSTLCVVLAIGGHAGLVGWIATACGLVAFVPQAVALVRTRDTAGLSLGSWSIGLAGVSCWLAYGLGLGTMQIVVSSIPPMVCSTVIVATLLRERVVRLEAASA